MEGTGYVLSESAAPQSISPLSQDPLAMTTMVGHGGGVISPLQVKDSRWLTLEVCREFTRNKCSRSELDCKFAHPPAHVEVQNGRVTCCFDSIKGKCQRKDPPCKYLHPPQHLREQLLQNGRNNLILKNLQMQAMAAGLQPVLPSMLPAMLPCENGTGGKQALQLPSAAFQQPQVMQAQYPFMATHPYLGAIHNLHAYAPYLGATLPMHQPPTIVSPAPQHPVEATSPPGTLVQAPKPAVRPDRLEPSASAGCTGESGWTTTYAPETVAPSSQYSHVYFQVADDSQYFGMSMPGMIPVMKRPAVTDGKSGLPMYQPPPAAGSYQQQAALAAMQLQQQQFVPVSIAGHPPSVPRF